VEMSCPSTHGASGYLEGSYWDGKDIICGGCGERITNPPPTGARVILYAFRENPIKWLLGKTKSVEPTWPEWITRKQ